MPDRHLVEGFTAWREHIAEALLFCFIGFLIAAGQLLNSQQPVTWRLALGRCISNAGLAMSAGAVLAWVPDLPLIAKIGIASALATLGTSGLEKILQRLTKGNGS